MPSTLYLELSNYIRPHLLLFDKRCDSKLVRRLASLTFLLDYFDELFWMALYLFFTYGGVWSFG